MMSWIRTAVKVLFTAGEMKGIIVQMPDDYVIIVLETTAGGS